MCGRFTLKTPRNVLAEEFPGIVFPQELPERFNVAPSQLVLAVTGNDPTHALPFRWGLIPSWAKDPKVGNKFINARAEGIAEKPAFRAAFRKRRGIVFADGFYEWQSVAKTKKKQPLYFTLRDGKPFALAALWEIWKPEAGDPVRSVTLITTEPNDVVRGIHDRMPVILPHGRIGAWLDAELPIDEAAAMLAPIDPTGMSMRKVSTVVNSAGHEGPDCLDAPEAEPSQGSLF
jgi:putative SOS response-associated peptidase YedK